MQIASSHAKPKALWPSASPTWCMVNPMLASQMADQRTNCKFLPARVILHPPPLHGLLIKDIYSVHVGALAEPRSDPTQQGHHQLFLVCVGFIK